MNMNKKILLIGLVMVLLMSTLVSAGFLSWIKSMFTGSVTGFAVAGTSCDADSECDSGLVCDWTQPLDNKKGRCVEFPDEKKLECQTRTDTVIAKLDLIRNRLKSLERGAQ